MKILNKLTFLILTVALIATSLVLTACGNEISDPNASVKAYITGQIVSLETKVANINTPAMPDSVSPMSLSLQSVPSDWSLVNGEWIIYDPDHTIDPGNIYGWWDYNGHYYHTWSEEFYKSLLTKETSDDYAEIKNIEITLEYIKKYISDELIGLEASLTNRLTKLDDSVATIKLYFEELFKRLDNFQVILDCINNRLDILSEQMDILSDRLDLISEQNEQLAERIRDLITTNGSLNERIISLSEQLAIVINQNQLITKSIENLTMINYTLSDKVDELLTLSRSLTEVIEKLTETVLAVSTNQSVQSGDIQLILDLIDDRDALTRQITALLSTNAALQAQVDALLSQESNPVHDDVTEVVENNNYKIIDDKFAIRIGYWEAARPFFKSIAVAAYGDTNIYKVETLAATGIWVDASTTVIFQKCFYTGTILNVNQTNMASSNIRITTNEGVYELIVSIESEFVNLYDGMQYSWSSFSDFYDAINL
jgi:hypothetical protein